jgi:sugar phosphate isomerase/epimerase
MHTFSTLTRREFLAVAAGLLAAGSVRAAGSSDDIQIGLCSGFDAAEKAKAGGIDYIEENFQKLAAPNDPDDKVLPRLEAAAKAALPVYSCNGFLPATLRVIGTDANHDGVIKFIETGFPRAAKAGVKVVVFGSGGARKLADGFSRDEAMKQMIALGKRIAPIAEKNGITVAIEPLNSSECNFLVHVSDIAEILDAVNHPNFAMTADVYHMAKENDGADALEKVVRHVKHLHIAEKEKRTAPGTAGDDFTPYFKVLRKAGYTGRMSLECGWKDQTAQLPVAVKTLRDQWKAAGA